MLNYKSCSIYSLVTFFGASLALICQKEPRCYCTFHNNTETTKIFCKNVANVSSIQKVLQEFPVVYSLRIYGESLSDLPSKSFGNASISILEISAPIATMADDALSSVVNLEIVNFKGTNFRTVPPGVAFPSLRTLEMTNGSLSRIDVQLRGMSVATDFLFGRNRVSSVLPAAFTDTRSMEYLDLSNNLIAFLDPTTFRSVLGLKQLNLGYNHLATVDGLFDTLDPEVIILYGNNLSSVEKAFHPRMWKTKQLDLGGNPNLNLTGTQIPMKYLTTLSLNQNGLQELEPHFLSHFSFLRELHLNDNNLTSLPTDFFAPCLRLTKLEVRNNGFSTIAEVVSFSGPPRKRMSLKSVSLAGNRIRSIDLDYSFHNVLHLDLSRNQIDRIRREDFQHLTHVTSLNLSGNPFTWLEAGCFGSRLTDLDLSQSRISSFNGTLRCLSELTQLRAASCALQSLGETELLGLQRLRHVDLRNNRLLSVSRAFKTNINLTALHIEGNNLVTLTADSFPEDDRKPPWEKIWMEDNPWSCDCRLSWFLNRLKNVEDDPRCHSPANLSGTLLRALNHSVLEVWEEDCPEECACRCVSEGEVAFSSVDCAHRNLSRQPPTLPRNAQEIDLRGNRLESFAESTATHLETLNIANNRLAELRLGQEIAVASLYLEGNNLTEIFPDQWNQTNLKRISLSRNPWKCECRTWNFRTWLLLHNASVVDLDEIRCSSGGELNNEVIIHLTYSDLCPEVSQKGIKIIASVACLVWLVIICLLVYNFRKTLSALLYSCGLTFLKRREQQHQHPFDAFLLYADEDDAFALGTIADGLERLGYNLFMPTRQILLSTSSVDVNSSIADSCKVIVILTSNLLRSPQCMHLLKAAMTTAAEDNSCHRFIFITTDKLPPEMTFDLILSALVRRSLQLRWGELLFWIKLRYHLPRKSNVPEEEHEELLHHSL